MLSARTFPLILAAPSGAGKTSLARELGARRVDVQFSISATTRPPRAAERDGVDYHFRSEAEFTAMVDRGELLEWARVHGHFYGTPRANLEEARARRHFLLLDIDIQGSRQIKAEVPDAVSVFILPPTGEELARRLASRGSESGDVRHRRLLAARAELAAATEFDYVLVNEDLSETVELIDAMLRSESTRTFRLPGLDDFVAGLVRGVDSALEAGNQ
jgi:guanylate kinase